MKRARPEADVEGRPRLVPRDEDREALEDLVVELLVADLDREREASA